MPKKTPQLAHWSGDEGNAYVDRNPKTIDAYEALYQKDYGTTRLSMNEEFLGALPRDIKILEVGSNVGVQLQFLRRQGFTNAVGVEINAHAIEEAKRVNPEVTITQGSGFELPFDDASFDLVFTSGVLIHISPQDIARIVGEMHRVTRRYLWGFEYYAPEYTEISYRGARDLLWKTDFAKLIMAQFPDLKMVREKRYRMSDGVNESQMYLLEK